MCRQAGPRVEGGTVNRLIQRLAGVEPFSIALPDRAENLINLD